MNTSLLWDNAVYVWPLIFMFVMNNFRIGEYIQFFFKIVTTSLVKEIAIRDTVSAEVMLALHEYLRDTADTTVLWSERSNYMLRVDPSISNYTEKYYAITLSEKTDVNMRTLIPGEGYSIIRAGKFGMMLVWNGTPREYDRAPDTKLYAFGMGAASRICEFIRFIIERRRTKGGETLPLFILDQSSSRGAWINSDFGFDKRPVDSVILRDAILNEIIQEIDTFIADAPLYAAKHVPYHRTYLLYGPPGNGKTSLIRVLATHFRRKLYWADSTIKSQSDSDLLNLLQSVPSDAFVVFEDVDALFAEQLLKDNNSDSPESHSTTIQLETRMIDSSTPRRQGPTHNSKATGLLTFSGVLNALDGLVTKKGLIIFMTTNHRDHLRNEAFLRPGRISRQIEIKNADAKQIRGIFNVFFPDEVALADRFVCQFDGKEISMAAIQTHCMLFAKDALKCVSQCKDLLDSLKE